jgi:hypothetical protein
LEQDRIKRESYILLRKFVGKAMKDRKQIRLEKAVDEAHRTLDFKYDLGQPGGIEQADKAVKKAIQELKDYLSNRTGSDNRELRIADRVAAGYRVRDTWNNPGDRFRRFDVYLRGKKIDSVSVQHDMSEKDVKDGLINHDGYDSGISLREVK